MSLTVRWWPAALAHYRDLWLGSNDPGGMADRFDDINRTLRDAAHEQGESRERATVRVWFPRPLMVVYRIDEAAGAVYVEGVRWVGP